MSVDEGSQRDIIRFNFGLTPNPKFSRSGAFAMNRRTLVVVLSILLITIALTAQTFRGSLQGTVTDSTGAVVPGAAVKVSSLDTGLVRNTTTNDQGNYSVSELPIGEYSVTISKAGFKDASLSRVPINVGSAQRGDLQLGTGQVAQSVEVQSDVPLIETTSNTTGGTIEGAQAAELPVNGRDFTKLLVMVPGATGDPVGSSDSPGSFGLFSVNGNRGRSNNYLLDGTDMNDGYRNLPAINEAGVFGTPATILPVDALAEVPVLSGVDAEFGRNSGAIVNLVTRSGTNHMHGSAYEFFRNDALDARNYFNPTGTPKNSFHNNQFGGSLGGALVKDKSFWFVAYEGQRETGGLPTPGTVPTQAAISDYVNGGNTINPVIQKILDLKPWGTLPVSGTGEVQFITPFTNRVDSFIGKIDEHLHLFSDSDLLTGRYFFGDSDQSFPLGLIGGGGSAPGYNTYTPTRVNVLSLSYTTIPKSNLIVEVRGGYLRFNESFLAQDRSFDPGTIGLNTLGAGASKNDFGMPLISISGFNSIGATPSVPRGRIDTNYQFFTNVSYMRGKHNLKWGYEFRRTFINGFFDAGYRGKLGFASLNDFLAGDPTGSSRSAQGNSRRYTSQNNDGLYLQDNWRITNRLTLNYGLRWDYYGVIAEKSNKLSILDPTTGALRFVGSQGLSSLYPKDLNNFGPRLSFAYDLTGKSRTVVRAGWGLYYDAFSQDFFTGQLPWNTFNPGPAYNDVQFVFAANQISANAPVYTGYSASDVFTVDQNLRTPYIQNFNVNMEQQISRGIAFEIGYVGSSGRKLFRYRDINQADPATGNRAFPALGYVNQFESSATSNYNSLQTSLKLRNWKGFTSTLNYTWGHSIDNASDGQDYVPNASQPDNSFNPAAERASSNFDTRHRIQWFWSYNVPKLPLWKPLAEGWSFDGVTLYSTGQPFNVNYMFEGDYNGTGEFFGRPDVVGNPHTGVSTPSSVLNLSAFAVPCTWDAVAGDCVPGTQHIGNLGRNAFRGPNYADFDFSVAKTQKFGEKLTMQIRADFFNLFNHPNFSNPVLPNFEVDFLQNGQNVAGNRLVGSGFLPVVATPDVGTGNPFLGGGGPRNVQLAVRFTF
jgi:Carboxypeptidase regulatory-like domain/TonB dependent receptor